MEDTDAIYRDRGRHEIRRRRWMSSSASGAMINSAAITASDPLFDFFPRKPGGRFFYQVGFSPGQLFLLPVMDWYRLGSRRKVIPQIFYELEFFRRTQVKDRRNRWVHTRHG